MGGDSVLSEAEKLEEGHPDAALAHMSLGSVYYHRQDYQARLPITT